MRPSDRPTTEGAEVTPEQLADHLAGADRQELVRVAQVALRNAERANRCVMEDHGGLLEELRSAKEARARAYARGYQQAADDIERAVLGDLAGERAGGRGERDARPGDRPAEGFATRSPEAREDNQDERWRRRITSGSKDAINDRAWGLFLDCGHLVFRPSEYSLPPDLMTDCEVCAADA